MKKEVVPSKGAAPPQKVDASKAGKPPSLRRQNSSQAKSKENNKELRKSKNLAEKGRKKSPNEVKFEPKTKPAAPVAPLAPPQPIPPTKA